ncbi:MAG: methylated-DNA--[protein]-cysteine S-methyltransferase [Acidimicrobiales bacterium]|nr:methylated-DNA--[protein]-cysteine S-methyltransferase [Acidimicrobiales bacterium]
MTDLLEPTRSPDARLTAAQARRLHDRLVRVAAAEGLLEIAYRRIDSPVGSLLLAATPIGLVRVAFAAEDHDAVLHHLAQAVSPRILEAPAALDEVVAQLDDYFAGRRRSFELAVDLRLARGFRRAVLEQLPSIGYGHTASYADIAAAAGNPRAVRAVGTACARNPLPLVVPCHRVVRSDGTIGQYLGGTDAKQTLLALERAA